MVNIGNAQAVYININDEYPFQHAIRAVYININDDCVFHVKSVLLRSILTLSHCFCVMNSNKEREAL